MLSHIRQDIEGSFSAFTSVAEVPTVIYENVTPDSTYREFIRPTFNFAPTPTDVGFAGSSRIDGIIIVQIFTQVGKGNGRAFAIADAVSAVIANKRFTNGTSTLSSSIRVVGIDIESRGLFQHNLIVPFTYYTTPISAIE